MSDLNASLGFSQFSKLESMISRRIEVAGRYLAAMKQGVPAPGCVYSRFLVVSERSPDDVCIEFSDAGIEAKKPVYKPIYACLERDGAKFPNARWAWENLISVPLYPALTDSEIERIESFLESRSHELRRWPPA
jgi:dTDP-4-amino-4,6-dideoxygalactose transaminase